MARHLLSARGPGRHDRRSPGRRCTAGARGPDDL